MALASFRDVLHAIGPHASGAELIDVSRTAPLNDPAVAIEVCGHAEDGLYRTMRGEDISDVAPRFEDVLKGPLLVGVGDGGNELGMGAAPLELFEALPFPRPVVAASRSINCPGISPFRATASHHTNARENCHVRCYDSRSR